MDAPEVHTPHKPHGKGVHWVELLMSGTALLVSALSIKIALHHGEIMEKLVTANSMPHIDIQSSNAIRGPDGEFQNALQIDVKNVGVGPADVRYVSIRREGRYLRSVADMMRVANVSDQDGLDTVLNQSRRHFIPAGSNAPLFIVRQPSDNVAAWNRLDLIRSEATVEVCYCSVFEECWITDSGTQGKRHVEMCEIPEDRVFIP